MVGRAPARTSPAAAPRPAPPQPTIATRRPPSQMPASRTAPTTPIGSVVYARQPLVLRTNRLAAPARLASLLTVSGSNSAYSLYGATIVAPPEGMPTAVN